MNQLYRLHNKHISRRQIFKFQQSSGHMEIFHKKVLFGQAVLESKKTPFGTDRFLCGQQDFFRYGLWQRCKRQTGYNIIGCLKTKLGQIMVYICCVSLNQIYIRFTGKFFFQFFVKNRILFDYKQFCMASFAAHQFFGKRTSSRAVFYNTFCA